MFEHYSWQDCDRIASNLRDHGKYAEAIPWGERALALARKRYGAEHLNVAHCLTNLAFLYDSQGRYEAAEPLFRQALQMRQRLLGEEHPHVASSLDNLAGLYFSQGRYEAAEPLFRQALQMRQRLLGEEHPDVATSLNNLAALYESQGRYEAAEPLYRQALQMRQRLLGEEHPDVATSLNNLAALYESQGRYEAAEPLLRQALQMRQRLLGEEHPDVAFSLNNLAALYESQGRYEAAEPLLRQALQMFQRLLGEEHPHVATSLNNLAGLYSSQGRYEAAEPLFRQALQMRQRRLGEEHPDVAQSLNNLALLYSSQGRYEAAEPLYRQALQMRQRRLGEEHPHVATSLNNLAGLYSSQGRYEAAEPLYRQALQMRQRRLGEEHPSVATSLNNLAFLYDSQGRYEAAEPLFRQALQMRQRRLGEEHPQVATSLNNLAALYHSQGRHREAFTQLQAALDVEDKLLNRIFTTGSERDRRSALERLRVTYYAFLSSLCTHFRQSPEEIRLALDVVLRRKVLNLVAMAAFNRALNSDRYPHLQDSFGKLRRLGDRVSRLYWELTNLARPSSSNAPETGNSNSDRDFQRLQSVRQELGSAQQEYDRLYQSIAPQIPELQLNEQADRHSVAAALPPESVLVEFVSFPLWDFEANTWGAWHYLAFVVSAQQPDNIVLVTCPAAAIDRAIAQLRAEIRHPVATLDALDANFDDDDSDRPSDTEAARQLYADLVAPLLNAIGPSQQLFLAPDAALCLLPWEILPASDSSDALLLDTYRLSYVSSGRDLLRDRIPDPRPATPALVLADPDFDYAPDPEFALNLRQPPSDRALPIFNATQSLLPLAQAIAPSNGHRLATSAIAGARSQTQAPRLSAQLVQTLDEQANDRAVGTDLLGKAVARASGVIPHLRKRASEPRLTQSQSPWLLCIATHGFYDGTRSLPPAPGETSDRRPETAIDDPMMRSGLALAGSNLVRRHNPTRDASLPTAIGKGMVLARDIAGLDLWANEICVLCACSSAIGDLSIGEGVAGMRSAFASAGAKTLIASLWNVPARASVMLMLQFFEHLKAGKPRYDALEAAKARVREIVVGELRQSQLGLEILGELTGNETFERDTPVNCDENHAPLKHPYYWAGWILQGQTSPVTNWEKLCQLQ